jgi:IS1 family transposase
MQKFTVLCNDAYGHVDAGVIPNELYEFYKQDIKTLWYWLESVEMKMRYGWHWMMYRNVRLMKHCIQYQNRLIEQVQRDQELKEVCRVIQNIFTKSLWYLTPPFNNISVLY